MSGSLTDVGEARGKHQLFGERVTGIHCKDSAFDTLCLGPLSNRAMPCRRGESICLGVRSTRTEVQHFACSDDVP